MSRKRIIRYFIFLTLFLFLGCSDSKFDTIVDSIQKGERKRSIIDKLGTPQKIETCPENLWWAEEFIGKDINKTCKSYFIYEGWFLKRWGIGFDKNDKVISKYF